MLIFFKEKRDKKVEETRQIFQGIVIARFASVTRGTWRVRNLHEFFFRNGFFRNGKKEQSFARKD